MTEINERVENGDLATELKTPILKMENDMMLVHPNLSLPATCNKVKIPIDG